MIRIVLAVAFVFSALPAMSQTKKEVSCGLQSDVVDAVQKARLDNVAERDVKAAVLAGDPTWPEKYNNVIPIVTGWVYGLTIKEVKENDLGDVWSELCIQHSPIEE